MEKHLRLLSVLYIVYGALHLLGGLVGWIVIRSAMSAQSMVPGRAVGLFMLANSIINVLLVSLILVSIAGIIGAIGLMNRKRWARILLLVISFLTLIHFPLGTALGIYGIWVLMKDETDSLFAENPAPVAHQQ